MIETQGQATKDPTEKKISLEDAHLLIDDLVNLQVQSENAIERYSVRLIGMSKGRSVLVTAPMVDGKYLFVREGQTFIMRGFSGKNAYAFPTQVLKSVNTPYPYLHLAYPREVRSLVVRKSARANVSVICAISAGDSGSLHVSGTIVNLSAGGAQVVVNKAAGQKGQRLVIKFKVAINEIEAVLKLDAVIRALDVDEFGESDTPYRIGVQFVEVAPEDSIPLMAFVYHKLLEQSL